MNSLATDSIFVAAISGDADLMQTLGGRLYSTAIPLPDEDVDNVPVPYVIVTFDGLNNDQGTKDDPYEGEYDTVNIGIVVTAANREQLASLAGSIRKTVHDYMLNMDDNPIQDYALSADAVQFDQFKPCYWQTIRYQCDVYNSEDDEQDQQ